MELSKEYKSLSLYLPGDRVSEEFELDYQENIPAYLDDVEKIIKCSSKCSIVDYEINSGCINLYGKTIISITYLSAQGYLLSNVFEEDFTRAVDIDNSSDISFAEVGVKAKYSSSRLINQRRVDVHISLEAQIKTFDKNTVTIMTNCKNAFVREYKTDLLMTRYASVTTTDFDETFTLNNGSQIKNIINVSTSSFVEEYKVIKEKMLVKIKSVASILYQSDDENIQRFRHTFTSSKIIDVSNSEESDKALINCDISSLYVKTKTDSENKLNELELVGRISISYKLIGDESFCFITDSYMPHNTAKLECENVRALNNPVYYNDSAVTQLSVPIDTGVVEVLDLNASVISADVVNSVLRFNVKVSVLYYDNDSDIKYIEKISEQELRLGDTEQNGITAINVQSLDFVIKGNDSIGVKLNLEYSAYLYDEKSLVIVSDLEETGEKDLSANSPLVLYFAEKGENVWDIAKEFSTDLIQIVDENNLKDDVIPEKQILLISEM